jgi:hypothetical protein
MSSQKPYLRTRPVLFHLACPTSYAPRKLFQQAQHETLNGWGWTTAFAVYPVVVTAIWVFIASHSNSLRYTLAFNVAIIVPLYVRLARIRRGLAGLAREHLESQL